MTAVSPLLLIVLPLAMAPFVYVLRRWATLSGLLAAAVSLLTARLCLSTPLDWSSRIWGGEMILEPLDRFFLAFAFALATVMFLYAWRISQGWSLFSFGLVILSLLSGALMIRSFLHSVLLVEIAAAIIVFLIQGGRRGSTRAALRYLIMMVMATPPFLLTARLLDLHVIAPDNLALVRLSVALLALGFGLLLGAVPFQAWLSTLGAEAPPMVTAFILSIINGVALLSMLDLLQRYPWLTMEAPVFRISTVAGLLTACTGGLLAFAQQDFGRLLAYAALSDMGCILVGLGTASPLGLSAALLLLFTRSVAVALAAMGLGAIRYYATSDAFARLGGVAGRMPIATLGLIGGGLSLAGFPLTGGFASRWLLYHALSGGNGLLTVALVLAGGGVALGYLRGLVAMLGRAEEERPPQKGWREPIIVSALIVIMAFLCLAMGLYPQLLLQLILRLIETYTFVGS